MKIAIIILHYGEKAITQACIVSLFAHENHPFSLILVNNMPDPLTQNDFPQKPITILNNKTNLGFAGGVNVGIQEAITQKMDAVLLLNNDTVITKPLLKELTQSLEIGKNAGITAPAIAFRKKGQTLYDLGGHIIFPFCKTYHTEVTNISLRVAKKIDYVSGCCMLIKKEVFEKVGLFDERFFLYYEDVDFCLKAKAKGFTVTVNPDVSIHHELSKSAGKLSSLSIYHQLRSAILFGKKYNTNALQRVLQLLFVFAQTLLFFKASPRPTLKALSAWKAAF